MTTRTAARSRADAYLSSRVRFGIKFGLETMRALCEELHHPERAFASVLVAGTNGKGSVVAYADAALRASGLAVGRYTSPHLVRVNERIAVGGRDVGSAAFEAAVERVRHAAARLVRARTIPAHPTYFEVLTAAALVHFRGARVDVAVLEVGMGGRLDATNVAAPLASAIVSVEKDHEAYLGSTLGAIAALAGTRWRGRLERIVMEGAPPLLLDGAHNPAAARALAAYLRDAAPFVLLFGVMADKDVEVMTRLLFPLAQAVVLTRAPSDRAAAPEEIARRAGEAARRAQMEAHPRPAPAPAPRPPPA